MSNKEQRVKKNFNKEQNYDKKSDISSHFELTSYEYLRIIVSFSGNLPING